MVERVSRGEVIAFRLASHNLSERLGTGELLAAAGRCGTLRSASMPTGVRLLPPGDPYIQTRDRDTIVEKPRQRDVWKMVGAPGTILAAGEIAGTWRARRKGHALTMTVAVFGSLSDRQRSVLRDEADQIGALRDASDVEIEFDGG